MFLGVTILSAWAMNGSPSGGLAGRSRPAAGSSRFISSGRLVETLRHTPPVKVVILAGGLGSRLAEETEVQAEAAGRDR